MTPRIEKLARDIDKTRAKISELQTRLREMEQQKTELENTEIVALFRSLEVVPDQLPAFIAKTKAATALPESDTEPVAEETPSITPPVSTYSSYTSSFSKEED